MEVRFFGEGKSKLLHRPDCETAEPTAAALRVNPTIVEVQAPGITSGNPRRRPKETASAAMAPRLTTTEARTGEEYSLAVNLAA